ncbi:MAG: hypothetical protein ABIT09_12420 [Croceibacterium sp.]
MVGRIRQNAEVVGRRMAPISDCRPNLIVAFVADGRAYLRAMAREQSLVFSELNPTERKVLLEEPGPVHVATRVVTRTRDGAPVLRERNLVDVPQANMWMAHSKIYVATQQNIIHALILIDRDAVRGIGIYQLADYATMRALVHHAPTARYTGGNSILDLFEAPANARPTGLTDYDHAVLGALYKGLPNLPASVQIAAIERATGRPFPRE